jgi:hypothetical protein
MQIDKENAQMVRAIYHSFLAGYPMTKIAYLLSFYKRPTAKGNIYWSSSSVRGILINERYCGDVVAQLAPAPSKTTWGLPFIPASIS